MHQDPLRAVPFTFLCSGGPEKNPSPVVMKTGKDRITGLGLRSPSLYRGRRIHPVGVSRTVPRPTH